MNNYFKHKHNNQTQQQPSNKSNTNILNQQKTRYIDTNLKNDNSYTETKTIKEIKSVQTQAIKSTEKNKTNTMTTNKHNNKHISTQHRHNNIKHFQNKKNNK